MAKKYIGLDEAAGFLGIKTEELIRLREGGKVRGFADRGTWKFKMDDLEELNRSLQVDSNPDVPMLPEETPSSSSVFGGDEDAMGEQSTTIRGAHDSQSGMAEGTSDSDVRLILDDSLDDNAPDKPVPSDFDSDSDVALFDDSTPTLDLSSDSDVALVGADSESDVRLAPAAPTDPGSDSDVKLVDENETVELSSDSDVKLVGDAGGNETGSSSDVALVLSDEAGSSIVLSDDEDEGESVLLSEESGIQLSAESGISLENLDDSGISLESDSGLTLAGEESGLSLLDADSGLTLDAESGIALAGADDDDETELEIPSLDSAGDAGDSEFELQLDDSGTDSGDSSVLLFDDEDDDLSEHSPTVVKKAGDVDDMEAESFDLTADNGDDGFDLEEDEYAAEDELEITDEVVGEDDELDDLDVFDADDDVFDEAMDTGESHAEFAAPAGFARVEAAPEAEWGGGTFAGLLVSTALMALCCMLMFDLVRGMWSWNGPTSFNSSLIETLAGLF